MQRRLVIGTIAIVVIGLCVWAYFAFFMGGSTVTTIPGGGALPTAGQTTSPGGTGTPNLSGGSAVTVISPRLIKISVGPVAFGEAVATKPATASSSAETTVTYIERQSGNIFSYNSGTKTITRISNKTVPGIQSASWLPNGSLAFVRYLSGADFSTINTYALSASSTSGFFLPQNLADISVSATGILTLSSGVNGSSASVARIDGTRSSEVFTTPLSSLRASFAGKGTYLVFTKPSADLAGDAFLVDSAGRFSRIAGPQNGLVALASPLGKWILVSYTLGGAMQMQLVNVANGSSLQLPVATIADKCVWASNDAAIYCGVPVNPSPDAVYPDDWYQGAVHFSDRIWKIDTAGRYAQLVLDFNKETDGDLDAAALAIDPLSTMLVFVNKNDASLWSYSL
ncbi:MAG: hypothetical protein PHV99_03475 [Candidatus Pacebacteria bacterium]|nr:hypothetical protein [Candidatus Paceibacterota bacterium]